MSALADLVARIRAEGAIDLTEAAKQMPPRAGGKFRTPGCVARYCRDGLRGVRLEAFPGPDGWITSRQAVTRFLNELARRGGLPVAPPPREEPKRRSNGVAELARIAEEHRKARRKPKD